MESTVQHPDNNADIEALKENKKELSGSEEGGAKSHSKRSTSASRGRDRSKSASKDSHRHRDDKNSKSSHNDKDRSLDRSKSRSRERHRRKERERSRDKDRDRYRAKRRSRDRDRSRSRERYRRRDRSRDRDRRPRDRSRSRDRYRGNSRDRYRRARSRSRSYSPVRQQRRKPKPQAPANKVWDGFQWVDKAVVTSQQEPTDAVVSLGGLPGIGAQKERRIYIGNLPVGITEDMVKEFLNTTMEACGGVPEGMSASVLSVWLGPENKYAFVEMVTPECATIALGLNGIQYMGVALRFARPKTYTVNGV